MPEQIRKSDIIQGNPFDEISKEIALALGQLDKFDNGIKSVAKEMATLTVENKKTVQGIEAITKAEKDSEKLMAEKLRNMKLEQQLLVEQEKVKQAQIRTEQQLQKATTAQTKAIQNEANAYKQLAAATRDQKNESKRLGAELLKLEADGKRNTKAFKDLEKQYRETTQAALQGDAQLKKLDKTVGDNFRNVGNYEKAIGGLKNMLGTFGVAFGGAQIIGNAVQTVSEFETQVADLSAVTGQTGKDLDFLKGKAVDFSKRFGASAASIAEAFKLAGSARPELLQNGEALADLTEKAIILSKASGDDVPTSIKNLTGTLNAFELDAGSAGKVMDTLANAAQLGSQEIPYLTDAFTKFGAIAKSSNISVAESAAAVELLGAKMPDASSAGTGLRNVMLKLMAPDAMGKDAQERLKALGVDFGTLSDKSKPFAERLEELKPLLKDGGALVKVFGSENAVAAQILLSQTDQLKNFTAGLDKNGTAQDQANIKSKTLAEGVGRLKAAWEGFILDITNGVGAAKGLTNALDFLSKNFNTIVSVVGQALKVFLAYKAAMLGLKALNMAKSFYDVAAAVAKGNMSLKDATSNMGKFGNVLKGAGIGMAITLFAELAMEIYDIASGAERARLNVEAMNKAMSKGSQYGSKRLQEIKDQYLIEKANAETAKNADKNFKERIKFEIEYLNESKRIAKERLEQMKFVEELQQKNQLFLTDIETKMIAKYQAEKNAIYEANAELKVYYAELKDIERAKLQDIISTNEQNEAADNYSNKTKKAAKDTNEHAKQMKSANEQIERMISLIKETDELNSEIALWENEQNIEAAVQAQVDAIEKTGKYSLESINMQLKAEYDLRKAILDRHLAEDLSNAKSEEERQNIQKRYNHEMDKLDLETKKKREGILKDLEERQEEWLDNKVKQEKEADDKINEQQLKSLQERVQIFENFQQAITNILTEQIDKRIALLEEEKKAAENQQNYLEQLAANGNITAQQSIAEQIQIQREAQAEQARLERQKQNIELISSGLSTFNAQLADGKSPGEALATTILSTQTLVGFLKNLQFFAKGTDYAPEGLAVVDEKGAEIITDSQGRIKDIGSNDGARFKYLNKGDKVLTATETSRILNGFESVNNAGKISKSDHAGNAYDLMILNKSLKEVKQAIEHNKVDIDLHMETFAGGMANIVKTERRGKDIVFNKYRVK